MKTAMVFWGLFSIAFAFPSPQPPHAGPLKKLEIEQKGSHLMSSDAKARGESFSSDGNDDKAQKGMLSAEVKDEEPTKPESFSSDGNDDKAQKGMLSAEVKDEEPTKPESFSSDGNDDKAQKEYSHLVSNDAKARGGMLSAEVKDEEPTKPESFSSDRNDDKAQKDVEAQQAARSVWISADNPEYKQLDRRAFSTLDLISPTASDDSSLQEIYASDDSDDAFEPVNERAFDAGNDPEAGAEAEFADDSLENVLASVDTENEPPSPAA